MAHLVRQQSLLAYLVMHRDSPQPRQRLAFLFWPEASEAQARANLRKALYDLRRLLPSIEDFVQIEDHFLHWRSSTATTLDVELFVTCLAQARQANRQEVAQVALEQAVALYTGDLLPDCYDDWLLPEREQLRQHYIRALEQLVGLLEQKRELTSALDYAQRILQCDALHESTYRLLMRLHVLNGDRSTALRVYHTCVTTLQDELGVEPSQETQQLYQRLLSGPNAPAEVPGEMPYATKGRLPLAGRQQEWKTLQDAWRTATTGMAQCVLIGGEAGIGKTRMAEELLQWTERQGYATAYTRSYAAEGGLAYAPITDWLRSDAVRSKLQGLDQVWLIEVARLLPELLAERPELLPLAPLADSWQRQRFREALARALLLGRQPLLLVIDDLQWCDHETLEWLHYLLRLAAQEPLLVVATVRMEEAENNPSLATLISNLRQAGQLIDIELGPLNSAETETLAAQVAGSALDRHQADALYIQTEGHPLFVVEMVRANAKMATASQPSSVPASLPPKVQAVIQSRLAQLSPPARELIGLAAMVGRAFTVEILTQASDGDEGSLVRALDELWQRRLIREQGEHGYDFSHDKIREVAYAGISLARRRLLHRGVAQSLEQIYATELDSISGELAAHYEQAGLREEAISYYQKAAQVAELVYAHTEAVHYLTKGLALLGQVTPTAAQIEQEFSLQFKLGECLIALKGISAAEVGDAFERAEELSTGLNNEYGHLLALRGLFQHYMSRAKLAQAHQVAQKYARIGQKMEHTIVSSIAGLLGVVYFHYGQWQTSRSYLEKAMERADPQPHSSLPPLRTQYEYSACGRHQAIVLWHLGYPDQAMQVMAETLAMAEKFSSPDKWTSVLTWYAWLYLYRREIQPTHQMAERALAYATRYAQPYWQSHCRILVGWAQAQQGDLERGMALMQEGLSSRLRGNAHIHQPTLMMHLAQVHGQARHPYLGLRLLDDALDVVEATGDRFCEAELYRLKAELLWMQSEQNEVESYLQQALRISRGQEAKSLELRAALSLARLWQNQGKGQAACELLAGVYAWFTEGFATTDLVEAKALLEALS